MNVVDATIREFLELQREQRFLNIVEKASARIRAEAVAKDAASDVPTIKAFDAMWAVSTKLHKCSDGIMRSEAQRKAWVENGTDELSELRQQLKQKHCNVDIEFRPGHICSCKH